MSRLMLMMLLCLSAGNLMVRGEDPTLFHVWNVTYGTLSPLGVAQQVILINGQFPGPTLNSTTNNNINLNIFNNLDEPLLFTWSGVQHRKNSWADGVPGTNCPIPPGTNHTFTFQVKDQIGSYMYFPSTGFLKAAGGYGGLTIHTRPVVPVPYDRFTEDDYTVLIGDWFTKSHRDLSKQLDSGRSLGRAAGVLINGKSGKPDGKGEPLFTMKAGKIYKYRICNTGIKTSLNFRIQGHTMKLVEMEGSHTVQNVYESLDVHVGQCFGVLVTANQPPKDYYIVASTRFTRNLITSTAIIRYADSNEPASPELPEAPVGWAWSLNQFRSFRWNLTASAARPNPQGSFHYGAINATRTIRLVSTSGRVDGKLRYAINGVSHIDPPTPLKLAEYYGVADQVFKYDSIRDEPPADLKDISIQPNVVNVTYRSYVEIILENKEKSIQTWNLNGHAFFPMGVEPGTWHPSKRENYNFLDAVSRHTIQVYPKCWAAIFLTFDNCGMWNLRSENWEKRYLGQQLYFSSLSAARSLKDEYSIPETALLCGIVKDMPKPPPYTI